MKYLAPFLILPLLFFPTPSHAAVAFGHNSATNTTSATSLTFAHNATGDSFLVVNVEARLTTGGCSTADVTNLAVTYAGTAMTMVKGSATGGVAGPAGSCVFGYLFTLAAPATGSNNIALTWTGTAGVAAAGMSYSGAGSIGTIGQSVASGNFSLSSTITANDLLEGALSVADTPGNFTLSNSNTNKSGDAGGNVGIGAETNAGSGSVTVNGLYTAGRLFWAVPILASVAVPAAPIEGLVHATFIN